MDDLTINEAVIAIAFEDLTVDELRVVSLSSQDRSLPEMILKLIKAWNLKPSEYPLGSSVRTNFFELLILDFRFPALSNIFGYFLQRHIVAFSLIVQSGDMEAKGGLEDVAVFSEF